MKSMESTPFPIPFYFISLLRCNTSDAGIEIKSIPGFQCWITSLHSIVLASYCEMAFRQYNEFMLSQSLAQVPVKYVSVQCKGGLQYL